MSADLVGPPTPVERFVVLVFRDGRWELVGQGAADDATRQLYAEHARTLGRRYVRRLHTADTA